MAGPPNARFRQARRAILERLVDQYCAAVVAHDPSACPCQRCTLHRDGPGARFGDGFWGTASGIGNYKFYFCDPDAGEVGFSAPWRESGNAVFWACGSSANSAGSPRSRPPFTAAAAAPPGTMQASTSSTSRASRSTPGSRRSRRGAHVAPGSHQHGQLLFRRPENNDGKGYYPFTNDCHRLENGVATSNNPDLKMGDDSFNPAACRSRRRSRRDITVSSRASRTAAFRSSTASAASFSPSPPSPCRNRAGRSSDQAGAISHALFQPAVLHPDLRSLQDREGAHLARSRRLAHRCHMRSRPAGPAAFRATEVAACVGAKPLRARRLRSWRSLHRRSAPAQTRAKAMRRLRAEFLPPRDCRSGKLPFRRS